MYLKTKRIFDIVFSILFIIILIPLFIVIIIYLKSSSNRVFFCQNRTGKNSKNFKIYKFNTSNENNSFLRKTGLDEIPQLFNILKGDMSFVGPRPWILEYSKYFNSEQKKRLEVMPGLTGYSQISKSKDIFEKIDKDLFYINNISILLDIKIMFKTISIVLKNEKIDYSEKEIKKEIEDLRKQNELN